MILVQPIRRIRCDEPFERLECDGPPLIRFDDGDFSWDAWDLEFFLRLWCRHRPVCGRWWELPEVIAIVAEVEARRRSRPAPPPRAPRP